MVATEVISFSFILATQFKKKKKKTNRFRLDTVLKRVDEFTDKKAT